MGDFQKGRIYKVHTDDGQSVNVAGENVNKMIDVLQNKLKHKVANVTHLEGQAEAGKPVKLSHPANAPDFWDQLGSAFEQSGVARRNKPANIAPHYAGEAGGGKAALRGEDHSLDNVNESPLRALAEPRFGENILDALQGAEQGASLGSSDELIGALPGTSVEAQRLRHDMARERSPVWYRVGEGAGAAASAMAGAPLIGRALGLGPTAVNAILGGTQGLMSSDRDSVGQAVKDTARGAAIGGLSGWALGKAFQAAKGRMSPNDRVDVRLGRADTPLELAVQPKTRPPAPPFPQHRVPDLAVEPAPKPPAPEPNLQGEPPLELDKQPPVEWHEHTPDGESLPTDEDLKFEGVPERGEPVTEGKLDVEDDDPEFRAIRPSARAPAHEPQLDEPADELPPPPPKRPSARYRPPADEEAAEPAPAKRPSARAPKAEELMPLESGEATPAEPSVKRPSARATLPGFPAPKAAELQPLNTANEGWNERTLAPGSREGAAAQEWQEAKPTPDYEGPHPAPAEPIQGTWHEAVPAEETAHAEPLAEAHEPSPRLTVSEPLPRPPSNSNNPLQWPNKAPTPSQAPALEPHEVGGPTRETPVWSGNPIDANKLAQPASGKPLGDMETIIERSPSQSPNRSVPPPRQSARPTASLSEASRIAQGGASSSPRLSLNPDLPPSAAEPVPAPTPMGRSKEAWATAGAAMGAATRIPGASYVLRHAAPLVGPPVVRAAAAMKALTPPPAAAIAVDREAGYGNRIPAAVREALQTNPQIFAKWPRLLKTAGDPEQFNATLLHLMQNDPSFRDEALPAIRRMTAGQEGRM
jgi:hypothetical protein